MPLVGLADTDCERAAAGLVAQPANALSGFAFLLAGAWIVLLGVRASPYRVELAVFGLAVASNTVGGLLFHGFQTAGARWVHDLGILSVLAFIVVFGVARSRRRGTLWTLQVYAAFVAAVGVFLALVPAATDVLSALLGAAAGVSALWEYRHELPAIRTEGLTARRAARLGVLVALALGATAFLVGRTGGWLCRPESVFQWHAVWHVLAAAAMGLYAYGAMAPHPLPRTEGRVPGLR
ncbi:MAG: hypothetical protein AB1551_00430 [Actinomycetota bacterium]